MSNIATLHPQAATPFLMDNPVFDPGQFSNMLQVAEIMAKAKLVPEHLQQKPADCFLVVEQSRRWNMSPFAVAQETYSVKGKLLFGGKLVTAVINSRAPIKAPLRFDYDGEADKCRVTVSATFKGEDEPRKYDITIGEAKAVAGNSTLWKTDPRQQAAYFAARFWARRHCPEVILGVWAEGDDEPAIGPDHARDVTPKADRAAERRAAQQALESVEVVDAFGAVAHVMPGEVEAWALSQLDGATPEQLEELAANNPGIELFAAQLQKGEPTPDPAEARRLFKEAKAALERGQHDIAVRARMEAAAHMEADPKIAKAFGDLFGDGEEAA